MKGKHSCPQSDDEFTWGGADKEEEKREILLIFIFIFNSMMDQSSIH